MKTTLISQKLKTLACSLALLSGATLSHAQTLTMLADNWAPFTDQEGATPGYMTEIAKAVIAKAGYSVKYELIPWTRAVADVKAGKADLLLAVLDSQVKEEGLIECAEPFAYTTMDFFTVKSSSWEFKGVSSLDGQSLGVIQDYVYGDEMDNYIKKYSKDESKVSFSTGEIPIETSIKKLVAGRITLLLDDRSVVMLHAKTLGMADKIRFAGSSGKPLPVYLAVSPKLANAAEVAAKISDTLKEFKKTPEYAQILAKYNITPVQ